jgi:hypothetical protein
MKEDKKTIEVLKKTIRGMEKESKVYITYRKLILACAESKNELIDIVDGLKFAAKNIKAKKWSIVERMLGSSGNLQARGICLKCKINLFGKNVRPLESSFPCGIEGCPFERKEKQG